MPAELVIVEGPEAGSRVELGSGEVSIGRAPDSTIRILSTGAAWRHCVVRPENGRYRLIDCKQGSGTWLNGLRTQEHVLEAGDQIGIGETTIMFRTVSEDADPDTATVTLLRSCSLLYLTRALASAQHEQEQVLIERQLVTLLADLMEIESGAVVLAPGAEELDRITARRTDTFADPLRKMLACVVKEGACADEASRLLAVPLYVAGQLAGIVAVRCTAHGALAFDRQRDALGAVAALCSTALETVREIQNLRSKAELLEDAVEQTTGMVGESGAMRRLLGLIDRVAPQDTTVLILGESGTGKELVARAIHRKSPRQARPFTAINCAALTETLLESELFGHEKGAFTGAVGQKKGKLELAEGGTVFLDEVGELAPSLQAKLLRVLQEREFERVGGTQTLRLNVRLIAATNRDLAADVRKGAFREDLYHRLNVIVLKTPPLRERPEDIPPLAQFFVLRFSGQCGRRVLGVSPEAERLLMSYRWPGNVRELENAIERAVVLGEADYVLPEDLPDTVLEQFRDSSELAPIFATVGEAKRESVIRAWAQAKGDYKSAARLLGLHPNSLLRLIRTLSLRDELPR